MKFCKIAPGDNDFLKQDVDALRLHPHPYEFNLYFGV